MELNRPIDFLEAGLNSGLIIRSPSELSLRALRYRMYATRRRDRKLAQKLYGPQAASRFDQLILNIFYDVERGLWTMAIQKETELLKSIVEIAMDKPLLRE